MKTRKRFIKKILLATLLIFLSAALTVFIKAALDTRSPEAALPIITVTHAGQPFLEHNIYRAGYTWSFFATTEKWQATNLTPQDLPIVAQEVQAGSEMQITFTTTPKELTVYRASGIHSTEFTQIAMQDLGTLYAPNDKGEYLYKVNGYWNSDDTIQYYFAISVA